MVAGGNPGGAARYSLPLIALVGIPCTLNGLSIRLPRIAACGLLPRRAYRPCGRCGRVAEGGGLLNRYRVVKPYRGFESLRLRQHSTWPAHAVRPYLTKASGSASSRPFPKSCPAGFDSHRRAAPASAFPPRSASRLGPKNRAFCNSVWPWRDSLLTSRSLLSRSLVLLAPCTTATLKAWHDARKSALSR